MAYLLRKSLLITGRKYPDGAAIPDSLPEKYGKSKRCDNCRLYVSTNKFCYRWDAIVRPEYVCAVWEPIKA